MILNFELSILLDEYLEKLGKSRGKTLIDKDFKMFANDDLKNIFELKLSNFHTLNGIENLSNLKSLTIESLPFQKMDYYLEINENKFLNHIKDFSIISELHNLEELKIDNDINIEKLDISNLKNLRVLYLNNNPKLRELIGLDKLENLENIFICGCNIETKLNFNNYLINTYTSESNILDINMYPNLISHNEKTAKALDKLSTMGYTNVKFAEQVGFMKYALLNTYNLKDMFIRVKKLITKYKVDEMSDLEKIGFAYDYVVNSVTFADKELRKRNELMNKYSDNLGVVPEVLHKNFAMIHSSYAALMYKRSNCEGFVNLMRFMLNLVNIKTHNVHCTGVNDANRVILNHSSIRVLLNDSWYYCEPTWETKGERNYFLKSKSEFQETHVLNILEQIVKDEKTDEKEHTRRISR